jgi:DNA-binding FrmR family transcriptional regulator
MLTDGQKAMLQKAKKAVEDVEGAVNALKSALEDLDALAENADPDTSLADLAGELTADDFECALYDLEGKLGGFEKALENYESECAEAAGGKEVGS